MSASGPFTETEKAKFTKLKNAKTNEDRATLYSQLSPSEKLRLGEWTKLALEYKKRIDAADQKITILEQQKQLNFTKHGAPALQELQQAGSANTAQKQKIDISERS